MGNFAIYHDKEQEILRKMYISGAFQATLEFILGVQKKSPGYALDYVMQHNWDKYFQSGEIVP